MIGFIDQGITLFLGIMFLCWLRRQLPCHYKGAGKELRSFFCLGVEGGALNAPKLFSSFPMHFQKLCILTLSFSLKYLN